MNNILYVTNIILCYQFIFNVTKLRVLSTFWPSKPSIFKTGLLTALSN